MEHSRPSQCERIIKYLEDYGTITCAEAITELGVYRLASRISELKKNGYAITKKMTRGINRWGEPTYFATYRLEN